MARILDPQPGMSVYDPACGSGGLLIKSHLRLLETHGSEVNNHRELPKDVPPLQLHGQEINPATYAIAKMNAVLHDMEADIALGDTMHRPAFTTTSGQMQQFDIVVANPMWNQDFQDAMYRNDPRDRFGFGIPPASTADWGWVQHMVASLGPEGRMAVVLDTGALSRGSGRSGSKSSREKEIRRAFVDADLIEAVVLLPDNLFYNTPAPGIVMFLNRKKSHRGEILLINAAEWFEKRRPKNALTSGYIAEIANLYTNWAQGAVGAAVVTKAQVAAADYDLSPGQHIANTPGSASMSMHNAIRVMTEAELELEVVESELSAMLSAAGHGLTSDAADSVDFSRVPFDRAISKERFRIGKLDRSKYQASGRFPIVDQGQEAIAGYTDQEDLAYDGPLPVVVFGDHTRVFKLVREPFVAGADGTKVLVPDRSIYDPEFFYFALRNLVIQSRGYNRHYSVLRQQTLPCPPLRDQVQVARLLSTIVLASDKERLKAASVDQLLSAAMADLLGRA